MQTVSQQSPVTGRHVPAQGAAAKTHKPRVAKIDVLRRTGNGLETIAKYSCEYYSKTELFRHIHNYFCTGASAHRLPDGLRITLPNGRWFFWNFKLAHYCFDHGRMTEDDFLLSTIEAMEKTPDEWNEQYRRAAV